MKYFSTFSGIGGFELGIQQAYERNNLRGGDRETKNSQSISSEQSVETTEPNTQRQGHPPSTEFIGDTGSLSCIGFSEIDKYAIQTYQKHFGNIPRTKEEVKNDLDYIKTIVSENNYDILEVCYVNNVKKETSFIKTTNQSVKTALENTNLTGVKAILNKAGQQGENIMLCEDNECSICMGEDVSVVENLKKCSLPLNIKTEMDTLKENNMELAICINSPSKNIDQTDTKSCATTVITLKEDIIYAHIKKTKSHRNWGDITKINAEELPDFDLLVGGFPCQSFSIAGKRKGFEDTRGTMFFELARILRAKQPRLFVFENVKGLLSSRTTLTFESIIDILSSEITINICNQIPTKEWEVTLDNLSTYHQKIGGINGLQKNLISLVEKTSQTIKKQNFFHTEKMQQLELSELEWDLNLQQLSSIDNLNILDIHLLEKMVDINGEIVLLLKNQLEENLNKQKLSIILMEINQTTDLQTCISALQEVNIMLFILKQWKLSNNYWTKIKSSSKKEDTYYVKTFNIIINELAELGYDTQWQVLNSKNHGVPQNRERVFIIGHLRGTSRPEVFPIGESNRESKEISQLNNPRHSNDRVYDPKGLSPTLNTAQGGNRQPNIITSTITTENAHGFGKNVTANQVYDIAVLTGKIRRLTPIECERLQGFPDNWTIGSDTQRYKQCGNAVTVNVIKDLFERIIK